MKKVVNQSKLDESLEVLDLRTSIVEKLNKLEIKTINDLWQTKRMYLKDNGFDNSEIYDIKVKLQLKSLDLNGKVYHE